VDVVDVAEPRTTGVSSVAVNFSEAVANLGLADVLLTRDGGSNLLTVANAPTSGNNINYTVPNLLSLTSISGTYVLTAGTASSVIRDVAGNALAANASDMWTHGLPAWLSAAGTAASWNSQTKALTITGAATIVADPASDTPAISASGAAAVLTINSSGGAAVNVATLSLASGATATVANHGVNPVRALALNAAPTIGAGSKLDLANNVLVIRNGSVAGLQSQVATGFNGGAWNGVGGINSSAAAASTTTGIGVASNATLNQTSFAGVTGLTSSAVLLKYTYYGDSDLNGATTLDDFTLFLNGYQTAGTTWLQGDYDYNGLVTLDDFTLFLAGYQQQGTPL
jgi:hypothetical protein